MMKNRFLPIALAGVAVVITAIGVSWFARFTLGYLFPPEQPATLEADRHAAGLGMVIAGEYLTMSSPQQEQVVTGPVQVEIVLKNPDPDYRVNLVVYLPNPPGLSYRQGDARPIAKILNTAHLSVPNLPGAAQGEEIVQGAIWNGEIAAGETLAMSLNYDLAAPLPSRTNLRAIAYDGLSGKPVDEATLTFLTEPGQLLPSPTPRYSLTPVAVPDRPAGAVLTPTLAVALQSQSFQGHDRAVQGLDSIIGSDLIRLTDDELPYKFRSLSLTQCYYLGVYFINRAALEFDTTAVPPDFNQATLRLRAMPPNPGGHTIEVYPGQWDWILGQGLNEEGLTIDTTNPAVWLHPDTPLAAFPVTGATAVIANLPLPRTAITPGGMTRLFLASSDETDVPPEGSCFTGGPTGLGGAITLPELIVQ